MDGRSLSISTVEFYRSTSLNSQFRQLTSRTYNEWPVGDDLTFGAKIGHAWQVSETETETTQLSGINEAYLFAAKHWRGERGWAFASRMTGVLETEKFARDVRIAGQDAAIGLAGVIGRSNDHFFAEIDFEERFSLGIDADQFRLQATVGVNYGPALIIVQSALTESHANSAAGGLNYDLGQISLSSVFPLSRRFSFEVGGRRDVYGEGIDKGTSAFISLWYQP